MGLLTRIYAGDIAAPPPWDDSWYGQAGMQSSAGIAVTPDSALQISAVWACTRLIAETLASLPLVTYHRLDNGGKERARNHPLYDVLHDRPNRWQSRFEFVEMLTGHAALRGFGIARRVAGDRGYVDELIPIHPDRVFRERIAGGDYRFRVTLPNGTEEVLIRDEVFELRGFGTDGMNPISPIEVARNSLGIALALDATAGSMFRNGVRISGTLEHPKELSDKARGNLRKAIAEQHSGAQNAGGFLLLEDGLHWQQIGMTNTDAEFLASRKFSVAEIARWFRCPPHKIGDLERSTNNNIETQSLEFVTDTIVPWATRWEQAILRQLIIAPQYYYAKFVIDGLLRGDIKSRYEAYAQGRQWGWLCADDIREKEDMNPLPNGAGQEYLVPLNMHPAGTARPDAASAAVKAQLRMLASDAGGRVVRKEIAAMGKLAEKATGDEWRSGVEAFYREHADFVAKTLRIADHVARSYCARQRDDLLVRGADALLDWEAERIPELTELASIVQEAAA